MEKEKAIQYAMYLENKYRHKQTRAIIGSLSAAIALVAITISVFPLADMFGLSPDNDQFNGFMLAMLVVAIAIIGRGAVDAFMAGRKAEKFANRIYRSIR
jgi:hypothetical protein